MCPAQRISLEYDAQYYEALTPLLRQQQPRPQPHAQPHAPFGAFSGFHQQHLMQQQQQAAFAPPPFGQQQAPPQPLRCSPSRINAYAEPRSGGKRAAMGEVAPAKRQRGVADAFFESSMDE